MERALHKIEVANLYCDLKNNGKYEESITVLKQAWPNTTTTAEQIAASVDSNLVDDVVTGAEVPRETQVASDYQDRNLLATQGTVPVAHYVQEGCFFVAPLLFEA